MAFQNGFILSIIHNNIPIREYNCDNERTCQVPFGSEYKIRLKNKSGARAFADISIDGMSIFPPGEQLFIRDRQTIDLERFVMDLDGGKKFKFISLEEGEKTGEIQDPTSSENGIIEVKFHKEIILRPKVTVTRGMGINSSFESQSFVYSSIDTPPLDFNNVSDSTCFVSQGMSNKGATAEGGHSDQKFQDINVSFNTEPPKVVRIKMVAPTPTAYNIGVFVGNSANPVSTFKNKHDAYAYAMSANYGDAPVTVRPVSM